MKISRRLLALTATVLATAPVAVAHHSYTRFDLARSVTLEGTVKEFQWTNPHVWVQMLVKDPATNSEVEWSLETDSPNMLARRGWSRKAMKPGDKVVAVIHPLKRIVDKCEGALESISVNGQRVGVAAGATPPESKP